MLAITNVPALESGSQCFFPLIKALNYTGSFYAAGLPLLQTQVASVGKEAAVAAVLPGEHRGEWIRVRRALTNSLSSSFSSSPQPVLFMPPEHRKQAEMLSVRATPLALLAYLFLHAPSLCCFSKACDAEEVKPRIKHQVTCEAHRGF